MFIAPGICPPEQNVNQGLCTQLDQYNRGQQRPHSLNLPKYIDCQQLFGETDTLYCEVSGHREFVDCALFTPGRETAI